MKFKYEAVKGIQAKSNYYIMMVPIGDLPKLITPNPTPEEYYQRALNQSRIPEIKNYILMNRDSYVFSAITVSISGSYSFSPIESNLSYGFLEANDDVVVKLNDGQHREAALIEAAKDDPSLNSETISVVVFEDYGLKRNQQMFTDLNKTAVKSSNSLATYFDSREPLSIYTTELVKNIPLLTRIIDVEKDTIGKNSMHFFSLNTLLKANKIIVGKRDDGNSLEQFLLDYWRSLFNSIKEWEKVTSGEMTKQYFRDFYILHFNVTLYAFAKIGNYFYKNSSQDYRTYLAKLENIDWSRENSSWFGSIFDKSGNVMTGEYSINLLSIKIKQLIGIELSKEEQHFTRKKRAQK